MSGTSNGQLANENTFNNAYIARNGDSNTVGKLDLQNPDSASGTDIINTQKEVNNLFTFLGAAKNQLIGLLPTFSNSNGFTASQSVFARAEAISAKFHQSTGHKHTGAAGDAPAIESDDLANVVLRGYPIQGSDIVIPGVASTDVSALMIGKTPSSGTTVKGVVVTAPYNKVPLFVRTGVETNDHLTDTAGNIVYGRITESAGVWTLTTYIDDDGIETPYSLSAGQIAAGVKWFFQELFNPIVDAPTYDSLFFVQSENATADVIDATATQRGLVSAIAQLFGGVKTFIDGIATDTISEETAAAGVTVDGVLLKDGLVDGRDVSTDGTNLDSHIANISNPHATTKAQVGLTNVTDDAQLKRAANDFSAFTEKTLLVADDIFLIEDSEASGQKKKVKRSNIGGGSGGSGAVNLLGTNGDAEGGASAWLLDSVAAATRPSGALNGSSAGITFATSASSPLFGANSFLFSKDAVNRQGQLVRLNHTVDLGYRAKILKIEVPHKVVSGTFVAGSSSADSDLIVYMREYNGSTYKWTEPSSFKFLSNSTTLSDMLQATYQTSSDTISADFVIYVASTSVLAYSVAFDNVVVSPSVYVYGTPITDWQSYSLTIGGTTTSPTEGTGVSKTAYWRRVGNDMEIRFQYSQTGAGSAGSGTYLFPLPSGHTVDTAKIGGTGSGHQSVGSSGAYDGTNTYVGNCALYSTSNIMINASRNNSSASSGNIGSGFVPLSGAIARFGFEASFPILGWSSSVQMSDQTDTRVVAARYSKNVVQSIPSGAVSTVLFEGLSKDTHSGYNTSNGKYTFYTCGQFKIRAKIFYTSASFTANAGVSLGYRINGGSVVWLDGEYLEIAATRFLSLNGEDSINVNSGDYLEFVTAHNEASARLLYGDGAYSHMSIERISGPQAIAASEKIKTIVRQNSGQSIPADTLTTVVCNIKTLDSHGAYNTANGNWTQPRPGGGKIYGVIMLSLIPAIASTLEVTVHKNGVRWFASWTTVSSVLNHYSLPFSTGITGTSGDVWTVACWHNTGATRTLLASDTYNVISYEMD